MSSVCRVCLSDNTRLYSVKNLKLRNLYETLANTQLCYRDGSEGALCSFCYQKLLRCHTFSQMAARSAKIFNHVYEMGLEITQDYMNEVNLLKEQHLSVAIMPFINIDAQETNKDELTIDVDIKAQVTTELDTSEHQDKDSEELSNTIDESKPESSITIDGDLDSIDIKVEVTELDDNDAVDESFPEQSKSRLTFEEDSVNKDVGLYESDAETKRKDTKWYNCKNCNKLFDAKSKLDSHFKKWHSLESSKFKAPPTDVEVTSINTSRRQKKNIFCSFCGRVVDSKSHLIRHMKTHKEKKRSYACNVCEKEFHRKDSLDEHIKTHTVSENTGSQVMFGCSDQTGKPQSVQMLIFLQDGEQRLVSFTLPKESCTLRQVLEQINVPFSEDTQIQCMQNCGSEIDYFVSVGPSTKIEEMLKNHPKFRSEMDSSSEVSTTEKYNFDPGYGSEPPESRPLPPPTPTRHYVDGMLALCKTCGYTGFDFRRCERCKRAFPEEPQGLPITS